MIKRELFPGWIFLTVIAGASLWTSNLVTIAGKHPIEASVIAIILGITFTHFDKVPAMLVPGVRSSEKLLALGIVLMGASLQVGLLMSKGWGILAVIAVTMVCGLASILALGRAFGLSGKLSFLLAIGTSICGGTAIAVIAPIIRAKDEETAYSVAVISLWGLLALLLYPYLSMALGASDLQFGIFAGTAIHSTPQVVGAGYIVSDAAGQMATAVKLIRNCFIAPLALGVAAWVSRSSASDGPAAVRKAFPWFLFGYFAVAGAAQLGVLPASWVGPMTDGGKFLILIGMVGVGANTKLGALAAVGARPAVVGLIGAVVVAAASMLLICIWGA